MKRNKRGKWTAGAILASIPGLICVVVLGLLFYGAMVYQIPEEDIAAQPGGVLALARAQLLGEQTEAVRYGGQTCTARVRTYQLENGAKAEAITASPAAYLERLSQEGYTPQLTAGFTLAGMDAVYALRGGACLIAAREGDTVYMIAADADEQAVYTMGAQAYLE
ncbi:MAG: hypothetical protein IKK34_09975 [Clostridia bacterium]|nr:hypothetical protein [Clostridia bacterium]